MQSSPPALGGISPFRSRQMLGAGVRRSVVRRRALVASVLLSALSARHFPGDTPRMAPIPLIHPSAWPPKAYILRFLGHVRSNTLVRPAWAHSCGCKSRREPVTVSEAKRNCGRVTDRGEEAWSEAAGRWTKTGYKAVPSRASGHKTAKLS